MTGGDFKFILGSEGAIMGVVSSRKNVPFKKVDLEKELENFEKAKLTPTGNLRPSSGAARIREARPLHPLRSGLAVPYSEGARWTKGTLTRMGVQGNQTPSCAQYALQWAYQFGAVCPDRVMGAGLIMPYANTEAMNCRSHRVYRHESGGLKHIP